MRRSEKKPERQQATDAAPAAKRKSSMVRARREPGHAGDAHAHRDSSGVQARSKPGQDGTASTRRERDRSLLLALKAGNREPALVRALVERIFRFLSRMTGPGPHLQDLVQETLARAIEALPRYDVDGPAELSTILFRIAINLVIDRRRRSENNVRQVEIDEDLEPLSDQRTPELIASDREDGRALRMAVLALPIDEQLTLVLSVYEELSTEEIGRVLGFSQEKVKRKLHEAKARLHKMLSPQGNP